MIEEIIENARLTSSGGMLFMTRFCLVESKRGELENRNKNTYNINCCGFFFLLY